MKKWYIIISLVFIGIGCNVKKGPAKIMFFEKEFNFGLVEQQKSITHTFEFQNGGGDTLVIGKIDSP